MISPSDAASLRRRFLEDIVSGLFRVVALTSDHYAEAGELIERHGTSHGLRTLDSVQLAVALNLHRGNVIENLVAAEKVLCTVAEIDGLPVTDPEFEAQ